MTSERILIVGAGLSGATVARTVAEAGFAVVVKEQHNYPGGHCHTYRDGETGIMLHAHGPHIFHSDDAEVWAFVQRFAALKPYIHRVLGVTGGRTYALPITLTTIRQFFGGKFDSHEAEVHLAGLRRQYKDAPANFEELGRGVVGDGLYEAFFDGYTRKQWGIDPAMLPASLLRRIPVRFSEDQGYFHHSRAAIPQDGYTAMVGAMLDHPAIAVTYGAEASPADASAFRHCVYTGPIDEWFGCCFGRLSYRTLDFDIRRSSGAVQEVAQVNYCDMGVPWTRIVEYKHFAPWEHHDRTVYVRETSRDRGPSDYPYYPLRLDADMRMVSRYFAAARNSIGVSYVGRLATYRYIDMDVAIAEALSASRQILAALNSQQAPPALFKIEADINT